MVHPLEPLTAEEVKTATSIIKGHAEFPLVKHRFVTVTLQEPTKHEMKAWPATLLKRMAYVEVLNSLTGEVIEAAADLEALSVMSWKTITGVQPQITPDECIEAEAAAMKDPAVAAKLLELYGLSDLSCVRGDPWSIGNMGAPEEQGKRLMQLFLYYLAPGDDNQYAHPIEGCVPIVDLHEMKVVNIEVYPEFVMPIPQTPHHYYADKVAAAAADSPSGDGGGGLRTDIKPVEITQPQGASFAVEGHKVEWQRWRLRVGWNSREGLLLHEVSYTDRGEVRPIMHRASLAEMVVPYGDPRKPHNRKIAFDVGEYGLGNMANSLELGCDCKGLIHYFDGVMNHSNGDPWVLKNAICLHEEDHGILWKHTDYRTGHVEVRRSRRLVVSAISTVVNYEYGLFWYFYQDGKIEFEIKHTGFVNTSGWDETAMGLPAHGTMVMPGVNAQFHSHHYAMRLDFDVDGQPNRVYELDQRTTTPEEAEAALATSSSCGPYRFNGMTLESTLLETELAARRNINPATARVWKVASASRKNRMGYPTAYKLHPGATAFPYATAMSSVLQRAAFPSYNLWVTPYDPEETHPAGNYPNQSLVGGGLPDWTAKDRSIVDTDLVLWYTFGLSHVPQAEDWPVMPTIYAGFMLHPSNFFNSNPANDVPPEKKAGMSSCCATTNGATNGHH